ncbi:hypothetical protein diail_9593 [Diaporthe ilicicola]|nr:hypothetical protein diail_9593 [Diaporthe ilicicola]
MALPFPVPASLSPAFTMSHATEADAECLAEVYYAAFQTDPGNTYWWPADKEPMMEWTVRRTRGKMRDRSVRHYKVVDVQTGDVVAFARWNIPEGSTRFGEWPGGDGEVDVSGLVRSEGEAPAPLTGGANTPGQSPAALDLPLGSKEELCRDFFDGLSRMSSKWVTKDMLNLSLIATSTKYFKRGAARALIVPMLEIADAEGVRAYLEATPAGKPIYEKLGFREVDSLEFNLDELTKDQHGVYKLCIMIREPAKK